MRSSILVLVALAGLAPPAAADTRTEGWYLGLGGGWTSLAPVTYALAPPAPPQLSRVDFGDTETLGASIGYRFPIPLRVETDFGFADYRAKFLRSTGPQTTPLSGGISTISFVTSAIYDIALPHGISLSLGFGLGAAEVDPTIRDPLGTHVNDPQMAFTWRAIGGFTIPLSDNLELQVDYRYQEISGSSHNSFSNAVMPVNLGVKQVQSAMASLRWYMDIP